MLKTYGDGAGMQRRYERWQNELKIQVDANANLNVNSQKYNKPCDGEIGGKNPVHIVVSKYFISQDARDMLGIEGEDTQVPEIFHLFHRVK
jgi:hypothetical protein